MIRTGVLPMQDIKDMMTGGFIRDIGEKYINPASLDLPLSTEAYRIEKVFLPRDSKQSVRSLFHELGAMLHDLKNPLEVGIPYLVRIEGSIRLHPKMYAYANPKSSTGRLNLFCRTVIDYIDMYDSLNPEEPEKWAGDVWVLVRPDSFPILLPPGKAVSQMRFFTGRGFLNEFEIRNAMSQPGLLCHENGHAFKPADYRLHGDALFLSAGIPEGAIAGWECRGTNKVLDFGKEKTYKPDDFFQPIEGKRSAITLRKGSFYILTTREGVRVPPEYSAELRATDQRLSNSRVHAAGFIDSGWGWGVDGTSPARPITLEVTVNEDNVFLQHGQRVARIRYEWMRQVPEKLYDEVGSNYTKQRVAQLSKHFVT